MLSVVIPALNEADHLIAVLRNVAEACPGAEVLVVDGGSSDSTADLASRAGVRLLRSARGRALQMNAGAGAAAGDTLLFLHADTRLPPGAAAAIHQVMRDHTVAGGRFGVRFDTPRLSLRVVAASMNFRSRLTGIATGDQAIFVRRSTFTALGGFAPIPLMEDVEFSRRLKRTGRLACLPVHVTTSARKWQREGVLRTILLMWALRLLYWLGVPAARLDQWYYPD